MIFLIKEQFIMIQINAIGDVCPVPVVKAMNAMKTLTDGDVVEILVDNETAVQNLTRFATNKGCQVRSEQLSNHEYKVTITLGQQPAAIKPSDGADACIPSGHKKNVVVVISSKSMGSGSDELGTALMKGFLYALSQQEVLPTTILLYNGGAELSCEGSVSLEDLKEMQRQGVEILTCGTCLNFYGLTERLAVGEVTNMYSIVEKMNQADLVIKP